MNALQTIRVAHPLASFVKGRDIARSAVVFLVLSCALHAQNSCGLTSATETTKLIYPPVAKVAHVSGIFVYMAKFRTDGAVENVRFINGPKGLQQLMERVSVEYISGWHGNRYTGPRECPVVIDFVLAGEASDPKTTVERLDPQHVRITTQTFPPAVNYSIASK